MEEEKNDELNSLIADYLLKKGYSNAYNAFIEEYKPLPHNGSSFKENNADILLVHFDNGNKTAFFNTWNEVISGSDKTLMAQKLEFYLRVYFAVFPVHPLNPERGDKNLLANEMQDFKHFIEKESTQLAKTSEFLSFYALPYVDDLEVNLI